MSALSGFLTAAGLLAVLNIARLWIPGWTYVPLGLVAAGLLVWVARQAGATDADVGLERRRLRRGLTIGAIASLAVAAIVAAAAAVPAFRGFFEDERAAGIGIAGLLYQTVLRIPLGTALLEETAFRGVLLGLGRRVWGRPAGTWTAALLFGAWHLVPAVDLARTNAVADDVAICGVMAVAVISTTFAGLVLTWIRDRTGGLAAPALIHAAANVSAFTAAWIAF
jgi:membrane protease YdiL (CAAX protease family)